MGAYLGVIAGLAIAVVGLALAVLVLAVTLRAWLG
jgi:hypothetical protein